MGENTPPDKCGNRFATQLASLAQPARQPARPHTRLHARGQAGMAPGYDCD